MPPAARWIIFAAMLAPAAARAQEPLPPLKGDDVRVTHQCRVSQGRVTRCAPDQFALTTRGRLESVEGDSLRLLVADVTPLAFPTKYVAALQVPHGRQGHFLAGAGLGLLAGIGVGALLVAANPTPANSTAGFPPNAVYLIFGPPLGFLLGGMVGAGITSPGWRSVPFEELRISGSPPPLQAGLRVSLRF